MSTLIIIFIYFDFLSSVAFVDTVFQRVVLWLVIHKH